MIKSTILLLLITYIFSEGIVNKSTYDYLKKTAPYEVKDWKANPFRKISREAFFSKYASKTIPKRHIKFGQPVSSIKEEFPDSNVYKETDNYNDEDNYVDYHDEDLSAYKRLAKK